MSVLIKGMEMPTSCWRCLLSQLYEKPREMLVCKITHEEVLRHKIDGNCPIIPVPDHVGGISITDFRLVPSNADRIRGMSDEELAEFLNTVNSCTCSFAMGKSPCDGKDCPCWLSWLKSEAEEGEQDG